jgi:hypothetical protein
MPFNACRSFTRFKPRTFVGSNDWITDQSKSDKSNRAIASLPGQETEPEISQFGDPICGYVT